MRHFLTSLALLATFAAAGQVNGFQLPYNPDINGDGVYGGVDLLGFLPLYGTQAASNPEPCDYDGTQWEELFFGLLDGTIILDSLYFSFIATDVNSYYLPGCPDVVTDTVTVSDFIMMKEGGSPDLVGYWSNGASGGVGFSFNSTYNLYRVNLPTSPFIQAYQSDGFFDPFGSVRLREYGLPLDVLVLDSSGVHYNNHTLPDYPYFEGDYSNNNGDGYIDDYWGFGGYMQDVDDNWVLIPYWHYAE